MKLIRCVFETCSIHPNVRNTKYNIIIVINTHVRANVKYNMCIKNIDLRIILCKCHVFFKYVELGSFFVHLYISQSHVKKNNRTMRGVGKYANTRDHNTPIDFQNIMLKKIHPVCY